ncbi:carboxypeptidase B-like [Glandiceps talaboti]
MSVPQLLLILATLAICYGYKARYDGYKVLRVEVSSEEDFTIMKGLQEMSELDFWRFPQDVMVPPAMLQYVKHVFDNNNVVYSDMIEDVQQLIDYQTSDQTQPGIQLERYDFTRYYDLAEIDEWVKLMAETYPDLVSDFVVGTSYEGREMRALKVGTTGGTTKQIIWFHGGIHAREWISPAVTMYMTNQLIDDYNDADEEVVALFDEFEFHILPVMNPDGYDYTWTTDRMWRKTRSPNEGSPCTGTDPNRNFDHQWGGASSNPCASDYRGAFAHSEIEVKTVTDYILETSQTRDFAMFIDIHSYGQLWLTPWAYTDVEPLDYPEQYACAEAATLALTAVHGTQYVFGNLMGNVQPGFGVSVDWGYGEARIIHSNLIELRDKGEFGFLLPDDQIIPTGEETYEGLKADLQCILDHQQI